MYKTHFNCCRYHLCLSQIKLNTAPTNFDVMYSETVRNVLHSYITSDGIGAERTLATWRRKIENRILKRSHEVHVIRLARN